MSHVFISYSHNDKDFVDPIIYKLKTSGLEVWSDVDIEAGSDWKLTIDEHIENSIALVLVLTPNSKTSEYVTYEWAYAMGKGIKIVPIVKNNPGLHPKLQGIQHIDFSIKTFANATDELINILKKPRFTVNVKDHSSFTDIKGIFTDHNLAYRHYSQLSEIKAGCVIAITKDESEDQVFLDELKGLPHRDQLTIILYTVKRNNLSLYNELDDLGINIRNGRTSVEDSLLKVINNM